MYMCFACMYIRMYVYICIYIYTYACVCIVCMCSLCVSGTHGSMQVRRRYGSPGTVATMGAGIEILVPCRAASALNCGASSPAPPVSSPWTCPLEVPQLCVLYSPLLSGLALGSYSSFATLVRSSLWLPRFIWHLSCQSVLCKPQVCVKEGCWVISFPSGWPFRLWTEDSAFGCWLW